MDNNKSKYNYIPLLLLVAIIAAIGYWFFTRPQDSAKQTETTNQTDTTPTTNEETKPEEETPTDVDPGSPPEDEEEETDTDTSVEGDFTTYSESKQTVGESTNTKEYTLKSITDASKTGYHNFVFTLDAKAVSTTASPYVSVNYSASLGALRVDLNGVTTDQSGIGYQKSRNIDKEGVIRLYHNVSADSTEELYDIGVSKSTPFKVFVTENGANSWKVTVDVKYPGGNTTSESSGNTEFSKDMQALEGCLAPDNCKVSAYSYGTSGGVLSIVFTVAGTTSRPTPAANAEYNSDSKLELEFLNLTSDGIYASMNNKVIGGITITTARVGGKSTYTFSGVSKEYRLTSTKSPNQVVLEIKL